MAAPTNPAEAFNKTLANGEPSTHGTFEKFGGGQLTQLKQTFANGRGSAENDPKATFTASQE
jgi:hypothetical protein